MKKMFFISSFLVIVLLPVVALSSYMTLFDASFNVDLQSNKFVYHNLSSSGDLVWGGYTTPNNPSHGDSNFYDDQMICAVAVEGTKNTTHDIVFDIRLASGTWGYLLDGSDYRFARPFGLDIIVRGDHNTISFEQIGLHDMSSNVQNFVRITVPSSVVSQYNSVWLDTLLVLDPFTSDSGKTIFDNTTYTVTPSNNPYKARIEVSIYEVTSSSTGESSTTLIGSYNIDLLGYYKTEIEQEDFSAILNIVPTSAAKSLDIERMGTTNISQVIANYYFSTKSYRNSQSSLGDKKVHFFLSSSSNGTTLGANGTSDGRFVLRYTKDGNVPSTLTKFNCVEFVAQIVSSTSSGSSKTFTGSTLYGNTSDYYSLDAENLTTTNHDDLTRWFDEGQILVQICDSSNWSTSRSWGVENLVAGLYTSTIYFHVVSDY